MCIEQWWNDSDKLKLEKSCPSATSSTTIPFGLAWYRTRASTSRPPTMSRAWTSWLPGSTSQRACLMTYVTPLLDLIRTSYHSLRYLCITWAYKITASVFRLQACYECVAMNVWINLPYVSVARVLKICVSVSRKVRFGAPVPRGFQNYRNTKFLITRTNIMTFQRWKKLYISSRRSINQLLTRTIRRRRGRSVDWWLCSIVTETSNDEQLRKEKSVWVWVENSCYY